LLFPISIEKEDKSDLFQTIEKTIT